MLKRNMLVAYHTDSLLIINIEINIIRPDLNYTCQYCAIILVYVTENNKQAQLHVII